MHFEKSFEYSSITSACIPYCGLPLHQQCQPWLRAPPTHTGFNSIRHYSPHWGTLNPQSKKRTENPGHLFLDQYSIPNSYLNITDGNMVDYTHILHSLIQLFCSTKQRCNYISQFMNTYNFEDNSKNLLLETNIQVNKNTAKKQDF